MDSGKESPWPGTLLGIALLITLPFAVLAWLLMQSTYNHIERYDRMARVLEAMDAGLSVVEHVETMRDLATANVYLDNGDVRARYDAARLKADERLQRFTAVTSQFDDAALAASSTRVEQAWRELDIADAQSNPVIPFETVERFNEEVYATMAGFFFVTDMTAGSPVNANELLLVMLETTRKARRELGLVRAIAIYTALREGYLGSTEAEYLDNAWTNLDRLARSLDHQFTDIGIRRRDAKVLADLAPVRAYLDRTEDALVLAPQIDNPDWQAAWREGELALTALRTTGNALVADARALVIAERDSQLQFDLVSALGLGLLYIVLMTLALMFWRTRYAVMRAHAESRAKSLFLARMSHEIRTPLNGVIGLAELLADTEPTPRQREYIELIGSAGRSLVSLINDILDHAKIEAGKLELETTILDIRALVSESVQVFGLRAGQNRTLIFCHIDDTIPQAITGDPTRIRQVLLNLISNAVKFTEQGRVDVVAESVVDNANQPRLRIEVRDTGIGLTPGEQQMLFNLFTQASPDVSRRFGGTGLGLSISRELVRMMDGSIGVYSGVGAGSVFWFELPLRGVEQAATAPARPLPSLPEPVLLVDPDGHLARAATQLPAQATPLLSIATGETDALRTLGLHADLRFIVVNGQRNPGEARETCRHLRARHPDARIRLLTAVGAPAEEARAGEDSRVEVVARSVFTPLQLLQLLTSPQAAGATEQSTSTRPVPAVLPTGLRVLVAEDNPVNQLVTRGLLRKLGIDAEIADDGRKAVERYIGQRGGYDMVLMDIDMPVMDGNTAARAIRRAEEANGWPRCPMLALSAHALPEYGALARDAGMDGQLVKPVTLATLADTLQRHYRPRRTAQGAGAPNDYTI